MLGGQCACPSPGIEQNALVGRTCDMCQPLHYVNGPGCSGELYDGYAYIQVVIL